MPDCQWLDEKKTSDEKMTYRHLQYANQASSLQRLNHGAKMSGHSERVEFFFFKDPAEPAFILSSGKGAPGVPGAGYRVQAK